MINNTSRINQETPREEIDTQQSVRIGLQVDSIDPFWVEVAETIWRMGQQSSATSPSATSSSATSSSATSPSATSPSAAGSPGLPSDEAFDPLPRFELVEIEYSAELQNIAEKAEEILALGLNALISGALPIPMVGHLLEDGLPIITLTEAILKHPLFVSPVGMYDSATMACRHLAERLDGRGRVAIIGGLVDEGIDDGQSRIDGAADLFSNYPDITYVHIPTSWTYDGASEHSLRAMAEMSEPFDGLFGLSDTIAFAGRDVGRELGLVDDETLIVGINGDPLAIAAIAQGEMNATVETSATALAEAAVGLACLAALGESFANEYSYHPQLITTDNVADVAFRKLITIADLPSRLVGRSRRNARQRIRQLEASLAINRQIGSILDHAQLPQEIADLIRSAYGYDHVQIFLWEDKAGVLSRLESDSSASPPLSRTLADAGALGWAFLGNRPIFVPDVQESRRFAVDERWPDIRSRVIIPVRLGGSTLGVLDLHSRTYKHHTQIELDGLQFLADQLGVAMRNARLYSEAQTALADAKRANQLRTRLLANVSHELREPLNVILGYSQAATSVPNPYGLELPSELREDFHHIEQSGHHLSRVINDLIDIAQAESGTLSLYRQPVDAQACLTEVFHSFLASADESEAGGRTQDVQWLLQLPARLPPVNADLVRLRQILFNLLSNAAKFTDSGRVVLGALTTPDHLHIWIEDTGVGIPLEIQAHIHEAFVTAEETEGALERERAGIGLGLAMTHYLVRLHRGRLRLDSRPGQGTVCHVWLPLPAAGEAELDSDQQEDEVSEQPLSALLDEMLLHAGELVRRTAAYIRERYDEDIARQEIAEAMGVSPRYISRVFRAETGLTPWQYLNRYRVARAQRLLVETDRSITEIAAIVGFGDPAYFSRIFRRESGKSPIAFRNAAV